MSDSYLYLNGLRFHYLHWNLSEGQKTLVLHHGLASNAHIWDLVAPLLAEAGLGVLALDARGHGLTDKPDEGYDFTTVTNDLAAFIDACHVEKPILVGHSWGGAVILEYATRFAIGLRAPARIVLVDGGITQMNDAPGSTWENTLQRLTPPKLAGMPLEEFTERLKTWNASWLPQDGRQEAILKIILSNFEIDEEERIAPRLILEHHVQILRAMWEFQTYDHYSRLRCPVLMLPTRPAQPYAPNEQMYLEAKQRGIEKAHQSIPNLQVQWLIDTIHDAPLQRPQELAKIIADFST